MVPTGQLPQYFEANDIAYRACGAVGLGFGHGKPQYMLYDYPAPKDDEVMGLRSALTVTPSVPPSRLSKKKSTSEETAPLETDDTTRSSAS